MSSPLRTPAIEPSGATPPRPALDASDLSDLSAAQVLAFLNQTWAHLEACGTALRALAAALAEQSTRPAHVGVGVGVEVVLEKPWTSDQVADHFGVEPETINAWCIEGQFPNAQSLKKSGWRIPPSDVKALNMKMPSRGKMKRVK